MPYSFKEIPESEQELTVFEDVENAYEVCDLTKLPQYEILDEQGDQITIVHSLSGAEALVSHLNR